MGSLLNSIWVQENGPIFFAELARTAGPGAMDMFRVIGAPDEVVAQIHAACATPRTEIPATAVLDFMRDHSPLVARLAKASPRIAAVLGSMPSTVRQQFSIRQTTPDNQTALASASEFYTSTPSQSTSSSVSASRSAVAAVTPVHSSMPPPAPPLPKSVSPPKRLNMAADSPLAASMGVLDDVAAEVKRSLQALSRSVREAVVERGATLNGLFVFKAGLGEAVLNPAIDDMRRHLVVWSTSNDETFNALTEAMYEPAVQTVGFELFKYLGQSHSPELTCKVDKINAFLGHLRSKAASIPPNARNIVIPRDFKYYPLGDDGF